MSEYGIVGVVLTSDKELVDIVSKDISLGVKDCYFNNDPIGIINYTGFNGHEFRFIDKLSQDEDGSTTISSEYKELCNIIFSNLYSDTIGVIVFKDYLLLITDTLFFEGKLLKRKANGGVYEIEYNDYVEVTDIDDLSEVEDDLLEVLNII